MNPAISNFQIKVEKIESMEITPDLPHEAELKESVDRSESESKHQQQSVSESPSIAEIQLKRRREFETKFNLFVKKSKKCVYLAIAVEESLQDEVKVPMVQTPQYPLKHAEPGKRNLVDDLLRLQGIKKEQEDEQNTRSSFIKKQLNFNDLALLLRKRMGIDDADRGLSRTSGIKTVPIDDLDTSNTLNSMESLLHTSIPPLIQRALDTAYGNQSSDGLEIGPHGTWLSTEDLKKINWTGVSAATRSLLSVLFDRQTLARSTLTGNPSNAFPDLPATEQLDPRKIQDLIYFMKCTFNSRERDIRSAITMKCADIRKANRKRLRKSKLRILF